MKISITGGTLPQAEIDAYVQRAFNKYGSGLSQLDIEVDGEFVNLHYHEAEKPFQRIRRITGYLVGDMTRWNNAKTAEERDRVKHV